MNRKTFEEIEKIPPKLWECMIQSAKDMGISVTKLAHACFWYALEQEKTGS